MVIGYINSKWSMPRRLALISAVFLIPSLAQLYLFAENKLKEISAIDREIAGAKLASAVWAKMSGDKGDRSIGRDSGTLDDAAKTLGVESGIAAFNNAKTQSAQVHQGIELLAQIASASGMATDSADDSYYAQEVFIQRLSGVKQAVAELHDTLSSPPTAEDDTNLAVNYAVLLRTNSKLKTALRKLVEQDASGEIKRALDDTPAQLVGKLDSIASQIKVADYRRTAIGNDIQSSLADADVMIGTAAGATGAVFLQLAEKHAAADASSLYWTLGILIAATILAIVMVALISKGTSHRLSDLVRTMEQLSHKDLSVSIPHLTDTNENGKIAAALSRF
ncbi:MAG TPA: methyl-accepting chemotaxis protein, partial [Hyphomicrobium sp.]|nr:methyl-accepting chemotaxis protein [Hyphomicrobium sp.]